MKTFRRLQKRGQASLKSAPQEVPAEPPRARQGVFTSSLRSTGNQDDATSPSQSRRPSSRSPMTSRRATQLPAVGSTMSLGLLDSPPKETSSPREKKELTSPNETVIEPETLQVLTEHIRSFSESMNSLLGHMASEEPASVKKTVGLQLLESIKGFVAQTASEAQLDWSNSIVPLTDKLVSVVQGWDPEKSTEPEQFQTAADSLLTSYTRHISNYLRGGDDDEGLPDSGEGGADESTDSFRDELLEHLVERSDSLPVLFQRSKAWSRFAKELITYLEKRAQLQAEFSRKLVAHAKTTLDVLAESSSQPGYKPWAAFIREHSTSAGRQVQLHTGSMHFFHTQPLIDARNNHEKIRKQLKETWSKECRRLSDAMVVMGKAKQKYEQCSTEWEKSLVQRQKEEQTKYKLKLEKRSREENEIRTKVDESRNTYLQAVDAVNLARDDLEMHRETIIVSLLDSLFASAHAVQDTLATCQSDQLAVVQGALDGLLAIGDLGNMEHPTQIIAADLTKADLAPEAFIVPAPFEFEAFKLESEVQNFLQKAAEPNLCLPEQDRDPSARSDERASTPTKALTAQDVASQPDMHAFVKYNIPSKCKHCKHACYFQAVTCTKCGIVCHRKCTEPLQVACSKGNTAVSRLKRSSSVFGSPLADQQPELQNGLPIIVSRITEAIEERGLDFEGLYRLSAVKSQVEKVCTDFERNPRAVQTSHVDIHVLCAVLKLYFRQLPESVIPVNVTPEFIKVARDRVVSMEDKSLEQQAVQRLAVLIEQLPAINYNTLAATIIHLKKVAEHSEENKMKPSNLGIVFGPTLFRSSDESLDTLIEMPLQSLLVELMIKFCDQLFAKFKSSSKRLKPVPFAIGVSEDEKEGDGEGSGDDSAAAAASAAAAVDGASLASPSSASAKAMRRSGGLYTSADLGAMGVDVDDDDEQEEEEEEVTLSVPDASQRKPGTLSLEDTQGFEPPSMSPPMAPDTPFDDAHSLRALDVERMDMSRASSYCSAPNSPAPSPPPSAGPTQRTAPLDMGLDPNRSSEGNALNLALALIEQAMEGVDEDDLLDTDSESEI